jgi:DNA-binding transcriptional LysR family regulator
VIVDAYYEQVYVSHDLRIGALRAFVSEHLTHALDSVRRSADDVKVVANTDDEAIRLQMITARTFDAAVYGRARVSERVHTRCTYARSDEHTAVAHGWTVVRCLLHNDTCPAHGIRLLSTSPIEHHKYGH